MVGNHIFPEVSAASPPHLVLAAASQEVKRPALQQPEAKISKAPLMIPFSKPKAGFFVNPLADLNALSWRQKTTVLTGDQLIPSRD